MICQRVHAAQRRIQHVLNEAALVHKEFEDGFMLAVCGQRMSNDIDYTAGRCAKIHTTDIRHCVGSRMVRKEVDVI